MKNMRFSISTACPVLFLLLISLFCTKYIYAYPIQFVDASGARISIAERPQRVVSLDPAVTEILFELGVGEVVTGITYHETHPVAAADKTIVGGSLTPSAAIIQGLTPDLIIISALQQQFRAHFKTSAGQVMQLQSDSLAHLYDNISLLGRIFAKEEQAQKLVERIQSDLRMVALKTAKIEQRQRKRVLRFMGRESVMIPGDDSFQNELIRAAGGIPPQLGKNGGVIEVSLAEWQKLNPQMIYGCGDDRETAERLLAQPGWKEVEAVRNGAIFYFPCELTCRNSVHSGEFAAWLASVVYEEQFSDARNLVAAEKITGSRPIDLPLDYVRSAGVFESSIFDFTNRTLVIDFKQPMRVTSTLEGERSGVLTVGNHFTPPPCWAGAHRLGLAQSRRHVYDVIGKSAENSSFLFTGADMKNLSVQSKTYQNMTVYALVTAGVESNAMRMSMDQGQFYEPGTINIIILTNMRLTPRAMTRAIISATEAKTAALQDLDVRSSSSPILWQATGTGTDELLVVEGAGTTLDNAGGHCKLGELIAAAVYAGVKDAVFHQNGITAQRSIFRRLHERRLTPYDLLHQCACFEGEDPTSLKEPLAELESVLLQPRYAAFMEAALALSDAYESGLVASLESYELHCRNLAEEIAGGKIKTWADLIASEKVPIVLRMSLNSLLNGVKARASRP